MAMGLRIRTSSLSSVESEPYVQAIKMETPGSDLLSALAVLYDGRFSDLTIICGTKTYTVHRAILSSRSGFFDGACNNPFMESQTGIIDLSEDDAEAVEHMIKWFYHLDYLMTPASPRRTSRSTSPQPSSPTKSEPISPTVRRPRKFNLSMIEDPLLAQAAGSTVKVEQEPETKPTALPTPPPEKENPFEEPESSKTPTRPDSAIEMIEEFNPFAPCNENEIPEQIADISKPLLTLHAKVYAIAEKYGINGLKNLARAKFSVQLRHHWQSSEFAEALNEVYETTIDEDRGLRNIVVQCFREHSELARQKDVAEVVKETPGLAWDLFRMAWGMPV